MENKHTSSVLLSSYELKLISSLCGLSSCLPCFFCDLSCSCMRSTCFSQLTVFSPGFNPNYSRNCGTRDNAIIKRNVRSLKTIFTRRIWTCRHLRQRQGVMKLGGENCSRRRGPKKKCERKSAPRLLIVSQKLPDKCLYTADSRQAFWLSYGKCQEKHEHGT